MGPVLGPHPAPVVVKDLRRKLDTRAFELFDRLFKATLFVLEREYCSTLRPRALGLPPVEPKSPICVHPGPRPSLLTTSSPRVFL